MHKGDNVVVVLNWDEPGAIAEGVLGNVVSEFYQVVDGRTYPRASIFPASARDEIHRIQVNRWELKKAYDDSMSLVYQLNNKKARGEF